MNKKHDEMLKNEVIERKLGSKSDVENMLKMTAASDESFLEMLVKNKVASEEDLLKILSEKLNIEYSGIKGVEIDSKVLLKVPIKLAAYYRIMPIKIENRILTVASSYPLEVRIMDDLRMQVGYDVRQILCTSEDIEETTKRLYGLGAETLEKIISKAPAKKDGERRAKPTEESIDDIEKIAGDVSIIRLVNQIILEAYKKRATDIHIEPYRGKINFRYRIDGVLYDANVSEDVKNFLHPILSRIKIMSNLNIVERRLPQDGRAIVKVQDTTLDLRVSFIPTPFGESVVIRILPTTMFFDLIKLGLSEDQLEKFESFIERPHGIVFVTGPTGSGKTTTLYACLSKINTRERKIITIEDPIEYEMSGITQIQVQNEIGLDFARGLRSMLRHDPDVMMVGEVRDLETAEIAIRVALTGHLVFSTLHTNDAASGITRLVEIGVEPFLVASSVVAFVAQRLVRINCPHCKKENNNYPDEIKNMIKEDLGLDDADKIKILKGDGCPNCNFTGFYGRTAIYEILPVDDTIQRLIMERAPISVIKRRGVEIGRKSLRQDGWIKVIKGLTTPDEVLRITHREEGNDDGAVNETPRNFNVRPQSGNTQTILSPGQEIRTRSEERPSDKRIYRRLDDRINIRFKQLKEEQKASLFDRKRINPEYMSSTKNISAGGLLFSSNEAPLVDSIIEIKLEIPHKRETIQCLGRVVRVETVEPKKNYNVAIVFLDISSKDRAYLDKYTHEEM
ncbi:MAG: ATPase, T2SS/T4P/T4SS family [Candidatus Omnitrophota bacterium]